MDTAIIAIVVAVAALATGTIAAFLDTDGHPGYGVLKMIAASGYLFVVLALGGLDSTYGMAVLVALVLSWFGDLFLIGHTRSAFLTGLTAFLLAHVAYAAAFAVAGFATRTVAFGAVAMVVVAGVVFQWLRANGLPESMAFPVGAYLLAIGVMVAFAAGTGSWIVLAGAAAFAVSDIFVARNRFVTTAPINRRLGLPLYFAAQLLLAWSVA